MVRLHIGKGVAGLGTNGLAVYLDVREEVSLIRRDGKGLALAVVDLHGAGGVNGAALARRGGDGVDLGGILHVHLDVVQPQGGAVLALVDKGELHGFLILEFVRDAYLGLGLFPSAELILLIPVPQLPDLLPGRAVVGGSHDLQVVVMVLHAPIVVGVEIKDHAGLGGLGAEVNGGGDEPLVLLFRLGDVHHGHLAAVLRALIPGLCCLALQAPAIGRETGLLKVLGEDGLGGHDDLGGVGVALGLDGIRLAVAGVVVDHDHQVLAEAGDVIGTRCLRPRLGFHYGVAGQLLGLGAVGDSDVGDILIIRHIEAHIILAVFVCNGNILGLRFLRVDGDGEGPGGFLVVDTVLVIGQLAADGHNDLGVVGHLGMVLLGAVPAELTVVLHAGGNDLIIIAAVDGLGLVLHVIGIVDIAGLLVLDLIRQGLDVS